MEYQMKISARSGAWAGEGHAQAFAVELLLTDGQTSTASAIPFTGGEMHRLADVHAQIAADCAHGDLAGVEADADLHGHAVARRASSSA